MSQADRETTYKQLEIFANVLSILQDNYVSEIDTKSALNGAIKGLLFSLDPHSAYLPPESFRELQDETKGSFSGIGIEVTIKNDFLTIVSPIADTPADKAGLKANDIILEINGEKTKNMSPYEAIEKLRGASGSEVTIAVYREGWEDLKKMTLKREDIPIQSVKADFLSPGVVYSRITKFQSHTSGEFRSKLQELKKKNQITGLILDLRSNPGGLLQQAVSVADFFLEKGKIVYTKGRRSDQNTVFSAHASGEKLKCPLVVLVNEGSASAAEIVAGAIQAHKRGIIVGTQTFGKGSVQSVLPLPGNTAIKLTTARYYTPEGRSIQAKGIVPDIVVEDTPNGNSTGMRLREADLDRHLSNDRDKEAPKETPRAENKAASKPAAKNGKERNLKEDDDEEMPQRLEYASKQDYQFQQALNLLKGLQIMQNKGK
jgi:carboxyl-terminal processing protease